MKLVTAAKFLFARDWRLARHVHPDVNELIVITSGTIETEIDNQVLTGSGGSALLYRKGVPHAERNVGGGTLRMIYVAFTGDLKPRGSMLMAGSDRRREFLASWLLEASTSDRELARALLQALIASYQQRGERENALISRVKAYVQSSIAQPLRLEQLAEAVAMSPSRFSHVFRIETGVSPMRYVRRARVEAAKTLLLTTPLPLRVIASTVGIRDEFEFSRIFRRETGIAPGEARRTSQKRSKH